MSKAKKKQERESREEKGFAIPSFPDFAFIVELESVVLITTEPVATFPHYRFPTTTPEECDKVFAAAEEIAINKKCHVVDALNFNADDPHTYDPVARNASHAAFKTSINALQAEIREGRRVPHS